MDFFEDYPTLEPEQKENFQRVVTRLLSGAVLSPGSPMKIDPDWRFTERRYELIDSYLRLGGWRLDIDLGLRLARAVHETGAQRARFTKLESLVLCSLRLLYHERMRLATEKEACEISTGDLRERLIHAGKAASQLSPRVLSHAIRRLARHSLVRIDRGFEGRDDEKILVDDLIERVLSSETISNMEERIRTYIAAQAKTETQSEAQPENQDEEPAE